MTPSLDSGRNRAEKSTNRPMNTALVVEGGALRGIFSTGILDVFVERRFNPFDFYIGVSSGASNLAAYLAEMVGRNKKIYTGYSLRPEFIDFTRFFRGGHLMDLDWLWNTTIREIRLDLQTIYTKQKPFIVVLTNVQTGEAVYKYTGAQDLEHVLKASSAMPLLYRSYPIVDALPMTDGGVADALPVGQAILLGARHIMVIRSRHRDYVKHHDPLDYLIRWHLRHRPLLQQAMTKRISRYDESINLIRKPPDGVTIIEICPPAKFRVSRLCQNRSILEEGYNHGRALAAYAIARWEGA